MARFIDELQRTHNCGQIRASNIDQEVILFGWVANRRDHGAIIFIDLRDRGGITQLVFDPEALMRHPLDRGWEYTRQAFPMFAPIK